MDRRVYFFLGAAAVCLALVAPTPEKFRWVAWTISAVYLALAVLFALDSLSAYVHRRGGRNG
ncbi:MAG: hypothetical protein AB7Q27_24360 [Acidimicrobiia bacterium]